MASTSEMAELIPFLNPKGQRPDIKALALQHILGMTGSADGLESIKKLALVTENGKENLFQTLVSYLVGLTTNSEQEIIAKDASLALINATADEDLAKLLLDLNFADSKPITVQLWARIKDPNCAVADPVCMILSNLTHIFNNSVRVFSDLTAEGITLNTIITIFCNESYNNKGANLHYLGPLISNLSQIEDARKQLLDHDNPVTISKLLAFTDYQTSHVRRGGIIGALRNCCFDSSSHEWLLSEDNGIDILPRLLLPLAGPTPSDMEPEEIEKLPVDLQYLDDDKRIEPDPDLRKMLIESIHQLCSTKAGREIIRLRNAYPILKELHKSETDIGLKLACENVVDILIKKEGCGEITVDNFHDVEVPSEMVPELNKMDEEYLKEES